MKNLNIVIPMAGSGTRFKKEGFDLPKPLIQINGKSLIEYSISSLGIKGRLIFITRLYDNPQYNKILSQKLKELGEDTIEIQTKRLTRGASETCLLASKYIDNDDGLIITNCDQYLAWDSSLFLNYINKTECDGVVVTHKSNDPKNSFAKINEDGNVVQFAEKNPISSDALVGIHYWRNGKDFVESSKKLLSDFENNLRPECFVSETFNYLIERNKIIKTYEIHPNEYISLGTPNDVSIYQSKIKEFYTEKPKTIFCDLDGTILKHLHKYSDVYHQDAKLLDGVIEKINEWDSIGHKIIFCTARKESSRETTEKQLRELGLCWDLLIMGLTSGSRVLINDKLTESDPDRSISINVITNDGFKKTDWNKYKL